MRNLHTAFHSDCTNLHSHNSAQGFPFLHILANTCYFLSFLIIAILTDMSWYLVVALICIYLMISVPEHLFVYLLAICISSLQKYLERSSAHFLIGWLFFALKLHVFFILYISPLSDMQCFLPYCRLPFYLVDGCLCCAELLVWCSPSCLFMLLLLLLWYQIFYKSSPRPVLRSLLPVSSSRSFMASGLKFKSSIHSKLIFCGT